MLKSLAVSLQPSPSWAALAGSGTAIGLITLFLPTHGGRSFVLLALGCLLGGALFLSTFGFASAYREFLVRRRAEGLIAQFLMIGIATVLFAPVLASGEILGQPVTGAFAPFGLQVAIGAAMFGAGMQLVGGCGSGTLFAVGGGSARMLVALAFFTAGSFIASLHMDLWQRLPSLGPIVLGELFGWGSAALLQLAALVGLVFALSRPGLASPRQVLPSGEAWWRGPWPLTFGAVALAALNFATLVVAGHPWSITWAFALWGAKTAAVFGWDPSTSPFWTADFQAQALAAPLLADTTTLMDIGIVLGALAAAGLSGRFAPRAAFTVRNTITAVVGGLAMGYGARIAFGCNIGAFFSGAASTSLHGWLWFVAALPGCAVGIRLDRWIAGRVR